MAHVSDIKLIRTDTTLDLSQKAEKGGNDEGTDGETSGGGGDEGSNTAVKGTILAGLLLVGAVGGFGSLGHIYKDQINAFLTQFSGFIRSLSVSLTSGDIIYGAAHQNAGGIGWTLYVEIQDQDRTLQCTARFGLCKISNSIFMTYLVCSTQHEYIVENEPIDAD
ncbi:unnamed protein product [Fraxinus pennsylvanica]|uniref:Uncharacterized protein n=1 Tax=Fraxinus pennsylvanica TaxID=56036 RepID=A0AAD2A730_9LAMI|nr:unnamed protein product [Fraxinus pennsylvanica]